MYKLREVSLAAQGSCYSDQFATRLLEKASKGCKVSRWLIQEEIWEGKDLRFCSQMLLSKATGELCSFSYCSVSQEEGDDD